ncbi:MAG: phosphoribosylamine--glycine ligase [Candidatus Dormibacteria bacterium]
MRILIVGSGGREHALASLCSRSAGRPEVLCSPGNGGTATCAENIAIAAEDAAGLARLVVARGIDLVVIGPDAAAAAGVGDSCVAAGAAVCGPTAAAARIESSKVFAKTLMDDADIPTARWRSGRRDDRAVLMELVDDLGGPCVVKADGLALGKGVFVCDDAGQAGDALAVCFDQRRFGTAGEAVLVEERLEGREVSVLALCDGVNARLLPAACDYKRAFDGDRGPNTGGMGAYSPPLDLDVDRLLSEVERRVIMPCLDALRWRRTPFRGCLYVGAMLCQEGLRVLEFNARFGDPEAQVILPLLEEDLVDLMVACGRSEVLPGRAGIREGASVGVVAASGAYPATAEGGQVISGLEELDAGVLCFHGGTRRDADGMVTATGGRVLTVVAGADDVESARKLAYANLGRINFEGMRYRADIATPPLEVRI